MSGASVRVPTSANGFIACPIVVPIEDKASGTQLIQELITDGCHGVTRYQPTGDTTMRLHAQIIDIVNRASDCTLIVRRGVHMFRANRSSADDRQITTTLQEVLSSERPINHQRIVPPTPNWRGCEASFAGMVRASAPPSLY
jgi:hypothetical protein